jgi:hypothetical protein
MKKWDFMNNFKILIVVALSIIGTSSCAPKEPYEIKSPCVSIDSKNPYERSPCTRRPLGGNDLA